MKATTTATTARTSFNHRAIMRRAHNLLKNFRAVGVTFAQCLERAWAEAKAATTFTLRTAHLDVAGRTWSGLKGASEAQMRYMFDLLPNVQRAALKAAYGNARQAARHYAAAHVSAAISSLAAGRAVIINLAS